METLASIINKTRSFLETPIVTLGNTSITLFEISHLIVLVALLFYLSGKLRSLVADRLLVKTTMELGARQATGTIIRYIVIAVGLVIILQTAGIDLTALNVLAGAVGIGLGFGLQNIVNNFISGIIILFERPIKVGDRIVVGEVDGDVVHIGARSTTVVTNDNISIIVPNSKFITENVVNWSHNDRSVRFRIPVSVAYGSDLALVERVLLEAADENINVLKKPVPEARLMEFGDNGLTFELLAWSDTLMQRKALLVSVLNRTIYMKFSQHRIEIPFPQRDIRILRK